MESFYQLWNFILSLLDSVFNLYTGSLILGSVFSLFVLRKLVNLVRKVMA